MLYCLKLLKSFLILAGCKTCSCLKWSKQSTLKIGLNSKGVQIKEDQRKKGLGSQLKEVKGKRNVPSEISTSANFTVQIQLKEWTNKDLIKWEKHWAKKTRRRLKEKEQRRKSKIKIPREVATGDGDCWRGCGREKCHNWFLLSNKTCFLGEKKDKRLLNILCKIWISPLVSL